jgi:hypothetical protein
MHRTVLSPAEYTHNVTNHSQALVAGSVGTNKIESAWPELKSYAKVYSNGAPGDGIQGFLCEYIFRRDIRRFGLNFMSELLSLI